MLRKFPLMLSTVGLFSAFSWIVSFYFIADFDSIYFPNPNTSLCGCDGCIAQFEPGFSELYNRTPEPFLSLESNISESIFKYWSSLQPWKYSFASYKETVKKVFEIFPLGPKLAEPNPDLCRTCAVVGNSCNLNGSHYGPLIDYHDIVIRINKAPTKGYERDVGSKTTHRVMYPNTATNLDNTTHLVFFPFKKNDLDWLIEAFTPRKERDKNSGLQANKDLVMILNPEFIKYVHHVWLEKKGGYPSTGFLTLILSLHMCDEVDVFGFGADENGSWNHYFEYVMPYKGFKTGQHPGTDEFRIIKKLQIQRKIRFFRGW